MKKVSIYSYRHYRPLLDDLLKGNNLSYRAFAELSDNLVSFPTLAKVLIKDPKGQYKQSQNLSPEKLAMVLKFFGYNRDEIRYGLLLRFENDCQALPQQGGSLCKVILAQTLQQSRSEERSPNNWAKGSDKSPSSGQLSPTALTLARLYDQIPDSFRKRLLTATLREASVVLERQRNLPGLARIRFLVNELKKS
ncbi:MAG: hypothetical protein KDD43_00660 [Bdellovibrionales bacterium]|nr:hypothetical protein [Bdellovibrionales bacterium]